MTPASLWAKRAPQAMGLLCHAPGQLLPLAQGECLNVDPGRGEGSVYRMLDPTLFFFFFKRHL